MHKVYPKPFQVMNVVQWPSPMETSVIDFSEGLVLTGVLPLVTTFAIYENTGTFLLAKQPLINTCRSRIITTTSVETKNHKLLSYLKKVKERGSQRYLSVAKTRKCIVDIFLQMSADVLNMFYHLSKEPFVDPKNRKTL